MMVVVPIGEDGEDAGHRSSETDPERIAGFAPRQATRPDVYARAHRRWRTLAVPMVAHATNNAIALGLSVLASRFAA
jgi:hypothetical protein